MNHIHFKIPSVIKENFRFSTLSFLFIIAYVNIFQLVFGAENSIVGVIFTILMSASMVRDLTATPVRHLFVQALVLVYMALAAYWVNVLPPLPSFLIHFVTLLLILYAFTYEYADHRYFPYILSYLFLVFISPVGAAQLPKRMLAMTAGAVSIMLYQWIMGRNRVVETARDELTDMIDDIRGYIAYKIQGAGEAPDLTDIRGKLCRLSLTVYERRKKVLCVSDASYSMIAAGRGLEHLLILIRELPEATSQAEKTFLTHVDKLLDAFRAFLQQESAALPLLDRPDFDMEGRDKTGDLFYRTLLYIRDRLQHMTDPQGKTRYQRTALSLGVRLQIALDFSPVRATYALRTALILSLATSLTRFLGLPHGKWLLFTLASVSLPYADDVPQKIKKRVLATLIGGMVSVAIYALIPSAAGRTAAMMLSGYLSFYFSDYTQTFACSTVGALGGAVFLETFGFGPVGRMFLIRVGYILAGAAAAYVLNCLICPYTRAKATRQLWKKYKAVTGLLTKVSGKDRTDNQLYYHLVIQAHMLEAKLTQNARMEDWTELPKLLAVCREQVRCAHRKLIPGRADAPAFEPGHLI